MEPQSPAPESAGAVRRRVFWWVFLTLAAAALGAWGLWRHRLSEAPGDVAREKAADLPAAGPGRPDGASAGTSLSIRKKLELPLELNVQQGNLAPVMAWIEKQLDLNFLYQADVSVLESVTIRAKNKPLREILGDVFSRRNLAFIVQRDAIVVIPCQHSVKSFLENGVRRAAYEAEAEILCRMNEPVELYCGDRGQFRIRLLAGPAPAGSDAVERRRVHYQLYEEGAVLASSALVAADDQWAEAPVERAKNLLLAVRPTIEDDVDVTLGVRFNYAVSQAAAALGKAAASGKSG